MIRYQPPLRDMKFVLVELLDMERALAELPSHANVTWDLAATVLTASARFSQEVLLPTNVVGDTDGCRFENGRVTAPPGFREAYRAFRDAGWQAMVGDPTYGGQGLPHVLARPGRGDAEFRQSSVGDVCQLDTRSLCSDRGPRQRGAETHLFARADPVVRDFTLPLAELLANLEHVTQELAVRALADRDEVGAAAVDYLRLLGHLTYAYLWARMAKRASEQSLAADPFYSAKLATARFYFQRLLPETASLLLSIRSGAENLLTLPAEAF